VNVVEECGVFIGVVFEEGVTDEVDAVRKEIKGMMKTKKKGPMITKKEEVRAEDVVDSVEDAVSAFEGMGAAVGAAVIVVRGPSKATDKKRMVLKETEFDVVVEDADVVEDAVVGADVAVGAKTVDKANKRSEIYSSHFLNLVIKTIFYMLFDHLIIHRFYIFQQFLILHRLFTIFFKIIKPIPSDSFSNYYSINYLTSKIQLF
jgi:hypothetical protein